MSRLQTPIRRNDTVLVTAGKDRGKRGRVLKIVSYAASDQCAEMKLGGDANTSTGGLSEVFSIQ